MVYIGGSKMKIDIEEFIERVKEHHARYCDYPCFTDSDILNLLLCKVLDIVPIKEDQGTTIVTKWDSTFGNLSYDHLVDSVFAVLEEYIEIEKGE